MTFDEIQREVGYAIKDTRADILLSIPDFINEAYLWIASEVPIPALKTVYTVDTVLSQAYLTMPSTFDGRLRYVGTADGPLNLMAGGLQELILKYPELNEEGSLEDVALEGTNLWYQPIPADETAIICIGFRFPVELTSPTDTPVDIPSFLHRDILVNKACELAYTRIEDGLEGDKPNTSFYAALAERGKTKLQEWYVRRNINVGRSVWGV